MNRRTKTKFDHFNFLAPLYERVIRPRLPEVLIRYAGIEPAHAVLDVGGGTGRVAQFLPAARLIVVADSAVDMLRQASRKDRLRTVCSLSEELPFADGSFERVVMVDAMHHVADQPLSAGELWRVLKPGGRIVIEEPDIHSFSVQLIALFEKLALMRSHFLTPLQISHLFAFENALVHIAVDKHTAWVVVNKLSESGRIGLPAVE